MSGFSSQSEEKPGTTNFRSKNSTYNIYQPGAVHFGKGDNITSSKGITMSLLWLLTHA